MGTMSHTILIMQTNDDPDTRILKDFDMKSGCFIHIVKMFETQHFTEFGDLHPYYLHDIYNYLDSFHTFKMYVFDSEIDGHMEYNIPWIKGELLEYFSSKTTVRLIVPMDQEVKTLYIALHETQVEITEDQQSGEFVSGFNVRRISVIPAPDEENPGNMPQ